jgi:hypothetical protein
MPETQRKARNAAAAEARRQMAVVERSIRRAEEQRREEERKKLEAAKKEAGGSSKPKRDMVTRKSSKASGLGEDVSMSESESMEDPQSTMTKSELTKREANAAWRLIKKGEAPPGYHLVSVST